MSNPGTWSRRNVLAAAVSGAAAACLPLRAWAATTLRWATVLPTTHPMVTMMDRVAKQVKDETGGSLEIQSEPGKGTTVSFTLDIFQDRVEGGASAPHAAE